MKIINLQKVLASSCPKCGSASHVAVESYRAGLKAAHQHSFYCVKCDQEFSAVADKVTCDVVPMQLLARPQRRATDRPHRTA